jgi:hypothetical protein
MRPDPEKKNGREHLNSVEERRAQQVMNKMIGLVQENRESL